MKSEEELLKIVEEHKLRRKELKEILDKDFIGLTLEDAKTLAESMDFTVIVTRVDKQNYPVTYDLQSHRMNFEVDDNKVSDVYIG